MQIRRYREAQQVQKGIAVSVGELEGDPFIEEYHI